MSELEGLTDEMKAAIGQQGPVVICEVTKQGIRAFARAVGYQSPVYFDEAVAREEGHPALPAPPGFLGMAVYRPGGTGPAEPTFRSPFRRVLNGGNQMEPLLPVYAGDVLEAVTTLENLELRDGRLGKMLIRTSQTVYTRKSDGAVVARTRSTGISY